MMDRSDRHYRYFMRRLTSQALLYTEMRTVHAILHGDQEHILGYSAEEHPIALQIGGGDPGTCAEAVRIAERWEYDEYNLNVGCPSERVEQGSFGACLMADPAHVAKIVEAMRKATSKPVTVKHRIGINGRDTYEDLEYFVRMMREAGSARAIVHARIALLGKGLSPKENRNIPPLRYGDVYALKESFPDYPIEINGGVHSCGEIDGHLTHVDGVMIGRAAYDDPWLFSEVDERYFGISAHNRSRRSRLTICGEMLPYIQRVERTRGVREAAYALTHMMGLFRGQPGARHWRIMLSSTAARKNPSGTLETLLQRSAPRLFG